MIQAGNDIFFLHSVLLISMECFNAKCKLSLSLSHHHNCFLLRSGIQMQRRRMPMGRRQSLLVADRSGTAARSHQGRTLQTKMTMQTQKNSEKSSHTQRQPPKKPRSEALLCQHRCSATLPGRCFETIVWLQVTALWDQLQQGSSGARGSDSAGASSSGNPPKAPARGGNDWGALCRPVPKGAPKEDKNRVSRPQTCLAMEYDTQLFSPPYLEDHLRKWGLRDMAQIELDITAPFSTKVTVR